MAEIGGKSVVRDIALKCMGDRMRKGDLRSVREIGLLISFTRKTVGMASCSSNFPEWSWHMLVIIHKPGM